MACFLDRLIKAGSEVLNLHHYTVGSQWNLDMQASYLYTILKSGLGTLYSDTGFNVFLKFLIKFMEILVQKEGQKSLSL